MAAVTLQMLAERRLRDLGVHGEPMSARKAAQRAEGKVSYETLRLIVKGEHSGKITSEVAEGLALALQVPPEQIYRAAGKRPPRGTFTLPPEADTLTPRERKAVLSVVDAILAAHEETAEKRAEGSERPGLRAVARKREDKRGR